MKGQKALMSSANCEWETPQDLFDALNDEFQFTLDVASTDENAKCEKHFTREQDGLAANWAGERVWCNPPYGRDVGKWVEKCAEHGRGGGLAVMLLPARTDTRWFHDYCYHGTEIRFIRGRLKFGKATESAPFPSMIVVFGKE